jgi:glycine cleavage system H lipoate-binding protein
MDAIIGTLQAIGIFIVGLVARVGLVLAVIAVLLAPVMLVMAAMRGWEALRLRVVGLKAAGGFLYRTGVYYAPGHTWLKPEGARLKIGIDDLAQRLLPWAVSVDLPRPGTEVKEGETVATISCGEQVVRIAAPVDGRVVAVNPAVARDPSLVKRDNYARGWLFAVAPKGGRHLALPIDEVARRWLASEGARLAGFFEQQFGISAADGGEWMAPPPSMLSPEQWKALTQAFLHA